jgi:SAM-dependent methyltransferase
MLHEPSMIMTAAGRAAWCNWGMVIPSPADDVWGEDDNARRYDAYAREYPNYRDTSRDLIAVALPADAGVLDVAVLDLACGTGVTSREILAVLGPAGRLTGADKSAAMLAVAASSTTDPRVTWVQTRAENVDQHVTYPVDVVVCNSAIWQTDFAATATAVRAATKTGGLFVFNMPVGFLADAASTPPSDRFPALLSEMRAIAERDYGWTPDAGAPPSRARQWLTRESICRSLADAGFDVEQAADVSHQESAESQRAWMSIPIFTRDRLAGLPYEQRMRVLEQAYEHLGPWEAGPAWWIVFAARASKG